MKTCPCDYRHLMDEFTIDCDPSIEKVLFKLCYHAAETLSGMKPSNLITLNGNCARHYLDFENDIKQIMPLSIEVLRRKRGVTLLVFDPKALLMHISKPENTTYLVSLGYPAFNLATIISRLKNQFSSGCPAEIGIFLGYPIKDVKAFQTKLQKPILTGYWNVYSDAQSAMSTFKKFDSARQRIGQKFKSGISPSSYLLSIKANSIV